MKKKKIGFVASSGGHWEELLCLKEIIDNNYSFFVTEKAGQIQEPDTKNVYVVEQMNRSEKSFFFNFIKLLWRSLRILLREKPDVIITTGALIAYPFCLFAKMMGRKVIYIESFARVYDRSLTGKLVYPLADLFLVQWESLKKLYPRAIYVGSIF